MATNLQIITDAYRLAQIVPHTAQPSGEEGATALRYMNGMIAEWKINDVDLGYFSQDTLSDTIPIPAHAEWAVKTNLAVILAETLGMPVPPRIDRFASAAYTSVARHSLNDQLSPSDNDHLPLGEGLVRGRYNISTDD